MRPNSLDRLVLTGFMGSGKTTVGRVLAQQLGWTFADLDDVVAYREGLSVPEIFAQRGEPAFRAAETAALAGLLAERQTVIALGGGAPETLALRELLVGAKNTAVVYLHAPFPVLYARCLDQAQVPGSTERPLLGGRQAAAERFERRKAVYAGVAHYTADAALGAPGAVADSIVTAFAEQLHP